MINISPKADEETGTYNNPRGTQPDAYDNPGDLVEGKEYDLFSTEDFEKIDEVILTEDGELKGEDGAIYEDLEDNMLLYEKESVDYSDVSTENDTGEDYEDIFEKIKEALDYDENDSSKNLKYSTYEVESCEGYDDIKNPMYDDNKELNFPYTVPDFLKDTSAGFCEILKGIKEGATYDPAVDTKNVIEDGPHERHLRGDATELVESNVGLKEFFEKLAGQEYETPAGKMAYKLGDFEDWLARGEGSVEPVEKAQDGMKYFENWLRGGDTDA